MTGHITRAIVAIACRAAGKYAGGDRRSAHVPHAEASGQSSRWQRVKAALVKGKDSQSYNLTCIRCRGT